MTDPLHLILPGSIRSKKNSKRPIKAGNRFKLIPSKAYLKWEKEARQSAWTQLPPGNFPHDRPVQVQVIAFYKGPRPDGSGILESVGDCLEGIVWLNDNQIDYWLGPDRIHDKKNPRTEVWVREMGGLSR